MKLVVLVVASCCCVLADKNLASARPHRVVRVGRNGRQVVSELSHGLNAGLSARGDRRVVLKRKGRVFPRVVSAPLAHHAAVPLAAPLTFANHRVHHGHGHHTVQLHHAPVPSTPIRLAPLPFASHTLHHAPAPVPASTARLAPLPIASHAVHHAPVPAPLPLASHAVHHAPVPAPLPLAFHTVHHAPVPVAPLPLASHTLHHAPVPAIPIRLAPLPLSVIPPPAPVPLAVVPLPPPPPVPGIRQPVVVAPTLEYGAPATVAPEVRAPLELYAAAPVPEVLPVVEAPAPAPVVEVSREVDLAYSAPSAPKEVVVTAVKAVPAYTAPRTAASEAVAVRAEPIAILRSVYHPPARTAVFDYSYETANGIKQEAVGTLRNVDNAEVSVMKGSYSYVGAGGQLYQVDWYADETGFHPSAPHFPKSVVPNHPEVAAAVRAQIEFAAKEDAAAAASSRAPAYAAPPPLAYGAPEEPLPSYSSR